MILEQCKGVHCVDLGENFQTHIFLQKFRFDTTENEPSGDVDLIKKCFFGGGCHILHLMGKGGAL